MRWTTPDKRNKATWIIIIAALLLFVGCASPKQARDVKTQGFLGDYSALQKGGENEAVLIYRDPAVNWKAYDKFLLDPVLIWQSPDAPMERGHEEDLQRMANNFYILLQRELSKDLEIAQIPAPKTLRIQVAITDASKQKPYLNTVSTVIPVGLAVSAAKDYITGKPSFVGEVTIEFKVTDAETGELLAAGVDRRVGSKMIDTESLDEWKDVNQAMEYWAKQARFRLCELQERDGCVKP